MSNENTETAVAGAEVPAPKRTIRAKFLCYSVENFASSQQAKLGAVMGGSAENESFNKASPSGKFEIMIDNPGAQGFIVPGKQYYLDVSEAGS